MAKRHGCLISLLSFLLIIVIIIGVGVVWFLNKTPAQVNLANFKINNYTVQQLGIADFRFVDMLKFAQSLTVSHDQNKIAPDCYVEADKQSADEKFQDTRIALGSTIHYKNLLYMNAQSVISAPLAQPLVLKTSEIAYVIDSALHQFYVSTEKDLIDAFGVEAVNVLQTLDASVVQVMLFTQSDKTLLTTVLRLNIADYVAELNGQLPFGIKIADTVFCTVTSEVKVDSIGNLVDVGFVSVTVNDQNSLISKVVLDALFMLIAEEDSEPLSSQQISQYVGIVIQILCEYIGGIGTKDGVINTYGSNGIDFATQMVTFLPSSKVVNL